MKRALWLLTSQRKQKVKLRTACRWIEDRYNKRVLLKTPRVWKSNDIDRGNYSQYLSDRYGSSLHFVKCEFMVP